MGQGLHPLHPAPHRPWVTLESTMVGQICDINIHAVPLLCYCRCIKTKHGRETYVVDLLLP